jgi:hypothetical protein
MISRSSCRRATIRVGPRLEQEPHRLDAVGGGGRVEGLDPHRVAGHGVDVGPLHDEEAHHVGMAEEGGQADRGEPVCRPCVGLAGVGPDQLRDPVEPTEGGGVEDVEHGAGGEDGVDHLGVAAVASPQDGRHAGGATGGRLRGVFGDDRPHFVGVSGLNGVEKGHRFGRLPIHQPFGKHSPARRGR